MSKNHKGTFISFLIIEDQGARFISSELDLFLKESKDLLLIPIKHPLTVIIDSADTDFQSEPLPSLNWIEQKELLKIRKQQACSKEDYQSVLFARGTASKPASLTTATVKKNTSLFRWIKQLRHLDLSIELITFSAFFDVLETGTFSHTYTETPSSRNLMRHTLHNHGAVILSRFSKNADKDVEKMYQENISYAERTFGLKSNDIKRHKNEVPFHKGPDFSQRITYLKTNTVSQRIQSKKHLDISLKKTFVPWLKKIFFLNRIHLKRIFKASLITFAVFFTQESWQLLESYLTLNNLERHHGNLQKKLSAARPSDQPVNIDFLAFRVQNNTLPLKILKKLPPTKNLQKISWKQQGSTIGSTLSLTFKKTIDMEIATKIKNLEKNLGGTATVEYPLDKSVCFSCQIPNTSAPQNHNEKQG